ncbi:hypothetical protein BS50DRAFT_570815 [Corynespora cassiicola Philippines]|uniref:Ricin B lectin domain-containing protein n=1 Tax=Corynespora cassiicola Philippines TaxID=1448308 RepID=A0A2T2P1F3_CORCC|nr:hypothetical protein BS50DRAFT_570815 [Corynespora cassiicola Philippines]
MDLDPNIWYRVTTAAAMEFQLSMAARAPQIDQSGRTIFFEGSNNNLRDQQWQFSPVNSFTFLLRTKASGRYGFMTADTENVCDEIVIRSYKDTPTNTAALWMILPWGDGTFYLSNQMCGEAIHLDFKATGGISLSRNITQPQPGQAFSFVKVGEINDPIFSTKSPPSAVSIVQTASPWQTLASDIPISVRVISTTSPLVTPSGRWSSSRYIQSSPTAQVHTRSHELSPSTAMGVGVTIGVIGLSPQAKRYRKAKMWKGFTPVTSARSTVVQSKSEDDLYVAELPVPESPAMVFSPPPSAGQISWHGRDSWHTFPGSPIVPNTPGLPVTPTTSPSELPV